MQNVPEEQFESLVSEQLDLLPDDLIKDLENVSVTVEDLPEDGSLRILALYRGVPLNTRGEFGGGYMPDNIVLYRKPMLAHAHDISVLRAEIRVTLVREIGQHLGMDDQTLREAGWI